MTQLFISHATEDKDAIARPLADLLIARGFEVWYDEYSLKMGDSLRREIDRALARCDFGIVVLSSYFFAKEWPQRELDGLAAREVTGKKVILPVWHGVDHQFVAARSPMLADRLGVPTSKGLPQVVDAIVSAAGVPPPTIATPHKLVRSYNIFTAKETGCPECGGKVTLTDVNTEIGEFVGASCESCEWTDDWVSLNWL